MKTDNQITAHETKQITTTDTFIEPLFNWEWYLWTSLPLLLYASNESEIQRIVLFGKLAVEREEKKRQKQ